VRRYLVRRAGQAIVVALLVVTIAFVLIHLAPGDPFTAAIDNPSVTQEIRAHWRATWGLDRPLPEQYVRYIAAVATGNLGYSFSQHRPVADALADAVPRTLLLMGVALALSFLLGIAAGVLQALRRGRWLDRVIGSVSLFFYSMPDFWLALMLLLLFGYWVPILPVGGIVNPIMDPYHGGLERLGDTLIHLVLPAGTLALLSAAAIARYQRSSMLDVINEDYVRTARAKGASNRSVVVRHALRNALLPVITIFGLAFPALLGGAVFIEKVFAWPGMGSMTVNAIALRDYPLVTAGVILGSLMVAVGSLLADILYAVADPRLRGTAGGGGR
jgi:peptide/nickel transport system permease protein